MIKKISLVNTFLADDLPPDWSMATISDLVGKDGVFKDGDWVESKDQDPNGDVRLIQLADIGDGEFRNRSSRFLTYEKAIELRCTFLNKGDVLVARMPDPLGRACIFPGDKRKSITVVDVCVVRPEDKAISKRWLMYFINAPAFRATVASLQTGSTRKRISRKNLAKLLFPVPPPNEQKRIVEEIEKQFSRLDEAVENLKRVKANLKRYKASVLKAAVEGKLTEEWRKANPDVEPADKLLERILAERRKNWEEAELAKMKVKGKEPKENKWKKKYKEPDAPDIEGLPTIPISWIWASFEQVSNRVTVGHVGSMKDEYIRSGIPFLRSQNVRENRYAPEGLKFISRAFHNKLAKSALKPGDMVVVRSGSVGVSCVIPTTLTEANCSDLVIVKQPNGIIPEYGAYYMNSIVHTRVASQKVGVALTHFNTKSMAAMPVPMPSWKEQKQIVSEVENKFSIIDGIEKEIDKNLIRADRLRQSVLRKAFSGKLIQSKE